MNDIWLCKLSTAENRVSSTLSHLMNQSLGRTIQVGNKLRQRQIALKWLHLSSVGVGTIDVIIFIQLAKYLHYSKIIFLSNPFFCAFKKNEKKQATVRKMRYFFKRDFLFQNGDFLSWEIFFFQNGFFSKMENFQMGDFFFKVGYFFQNGRFFKIAIFFSKIGDFFQNG